MIKEGKNVAILIVLIFVLLFMVTFTGIMRCSDLPVMGEAWCNVYWGIKTFATGAPKVLIVYGESGLGNPVGVGNGSLEELLADPAILGVYADTLPIDSVNFGNLKGYDIIIVDRAKEIETRQLRAFIDYAMQPTGGILVWTGDAGTKLGREDHYLYTQDIDPETDVNRIIGPWARKDGDMMVSFDELLGVRTVDTNKATFCELVQCPTSNPFLAGNLITEPSGNHRLIKGLSRILPLFVFNGEDFGVVETISGSNTTEVLSLDFGAEIDAVGRDLNRSVPMIVTSGVGERVVYYALPPEYYANPKLEAFGKGRYLLPIENLYYGNIKG